MLDHDPIEKMTTRQAMATPKPFGRKYRGWSLEAIAEQDPLHLDWLHRKAEIYSLRLRKAVELVARHPDVRERIIRARAAKQRHTRRNFHLPGDYI